MKMKPSLHSRCSQSLHFCSSEPSEHCGVESHSRPGSKQQPFAQVNCPVVHGASHFSPVAHKRRGKLVNISGASKEPYTPLRTEASVETRK